jgi:site-specific DNA-methyltransferase (adenine-specific)
MSHVAGNTNTKTIRHLPVVTEVCVQYTKNAFFYIDGTPLSMKDWLRHEWERSGLPFSKTNDACGVKNAATRKYFTKCHLWYMPPPEAFSKLADYANCYGNPEGKPYFSTNGIEPLGANEWEKMRSKFKCPIGVTNVWNTPQLRNDERLKINMKAVHLNQKPLELVKRLIEISSEQEDIIWDPFGGLFTAAIAAWETERKCYSAEINPDIYRIAIDRVNKELQQGRQCALKYAV